MMKRITVAFALLLAAALGGCATVETAKEQLDAGSSRTYPASLEAVWDAALKAVRSVGLTVTEADKSTSTISAERSVTALSWGERVAVRVTKKGEVETQVQVMSKAALATNVTAKNFEPAILDRIAAILPGPGGRPLLSGSALQGYEEFQDKPYPRAFVISDGGRYNAVWGRKNASTDSVAEEALQKCKQMGRPNCRLYAVNGDVVVDR